MVGTYISAYCCSVQSSLAGCRCPRFLEKFRSVPPLALRSSRLNPLVLLSKLKTSFYFRLHLLPFITALIIPIYVDTSLIMMGALKRKLTRKKKASDETDVRPSP